MDLFLIIYELKWTIYQIWTIRVSYPYIIKIMIINNCSTFRLKSDYPCHMNLTAVAMNFPKIPTICIQFLKANIHVKITLDVS